MHERILVAPVKTCSGALECGKLRIDPRHHPGKVIVFIRVELRAGRSYLGAADGFTPSQYFFSPGKRHTSL
ncbi:MAG: hypothetical protein ACKO8O_02395, partial [Betaproteobacteria bacterium]